MTRKEIMAVFYRATMNILGYDPELFKTKPPVRQTYQRDGAPDWTVDDDVCFLTYGDAEDETVRPIHETYEKTDEGFIRHCRMNHVLKITFTAYGEHAHENLNLIRRSIYDGNKDLRDAGIWHVPTDTAVHYVPELYGGMWWERADMTLLFNYAYTWDEEIPAIEQVNADIIANEPKDSVKVLTDSIIIKKG